MPPQEMVVSQYRLDTDLDWQTRKRSGALTTTGTPVVNQRMGENTATRAELCSHAVYDAQAINAKWRPQLNQGKD
jgi:hypothetical protein